MEHAIGIIGAFCQRRQILWQFPEQLIQIENFLKDGIRKVLND
jgi:hypothetical protein